jgi:hypothetical protein
MFQSTEYLSGLPGTYRIQALPRRYRKKILGFVVRTRKAVQAFPPPRELTEAQELLTEIRDLFQKPWNLSLNIFGSNIWVGVRFQVLKNTTVCLRRAT